MSTTTDTRAFLSDRRRLIDRKLGQKEALVAEFERTLAAAEQAEQLAETMERASALLNTIGEEKQQEAQALIESIVTRGLRAIFDDSLSLVIETKTTGATTSTDFLIRTDLGDTVFETPVIDSRGGGMVAVVGFLLRATLVLLTQPEDRRLLILDETFAHVSAEYLDAVGSFLRELVDEAKLQILMVTHQPELAAHADKVYAVSQKDARTRVKEVEHA